MGFEGGVFVCCGVLRERGGGGRWLEELRIECREEDVYR